MGKIVKKEVQKINSAPSKTIIEMPELDGDTQIWAGQAVVMLLRDNIAESPFL